MLIVRLLLEAQLIDYGYTVSLDNLDSKDILYRFIVVDEIRKRQKELEARETNRHQGRRTSAIPGLNAPTISRHR